MAGGGAEVGNKRAGIGRNVVKDDGYFCLLALALFVFFLSFWLGHGETHLQI